MEKTLWVQMKACNEVFYTNAYANKTLTREKVLGERRLNYAL